MWMVVYSSNHMAWYGKGRSVRHWMQWRRRRAWFTAPGARPRGGGGEAQATERVLPEPPYWDFGLFACGVTHFSIFSGPDKTDASGTPQGARPWVGQAQGIEPSNFALLHPVVAAHFAFSFHRILLSSKSIQIKNDNWFTAVSHKQGRRPWLVETYCNPNEILIFWFTSSCTVWKIQ